MTTSKQRMFVERVVNDAIIQAAECSGLRSWMIADGLEVFKQIKDNPNADEQLLQFFAPLIGAFEDIVPEEHRDIFVVSRCEAGGYAG
jgi:hypothetical protein